MDLRLQIPKAYPLSFDVGPTQAPAAPDFDPIPANPSAAIDYRSIPMGVDMRRGNRLTPELLSHFPYSESGGAMLDVGCGGEPFRKVAKLTNMDYIGVDYDQAPHFLADAHALPFKDSSFDFAISFAVLEHLRNPYVALREIARVMKPGARFIGTVAFLEPFHLNSYFHPSHLGAWTLLSTAGLTVKHLEPNADWSGLDAQSWMSLFPHSPMWLSKLMVLPLQILHRLWWKLGHLLQPRYATSEKARRLSNTAGFRFVCEKPV